MNNQRTFKKKLSRTKHSIYITDMIYSGFHNNPMVKRRYQAMVKGFMQLVGYSSFCQKTLERMQYYGGKIFEGKHRSREMHKEGDLRLPCGYC